MQSEQETQLSQRVKEKVKKKKKIILSDAPAQFFSLLFLFFLSRTQSTRST